MSRTVSNWPSNGRGRGAGRQLRRDPRLSRACRFADCRHAGELGCAVRAAIERGELDADRYENHAKLKKEAAHHEMSLVEKRRKDKAFGKFLKTRKESVRKK